MASDQKTFMKKSIHEYSLPCAAIVCRHDFVVVETIDFYQDEEAELPAPLTLAEVKMLNKAAPFGAEEEAALEDDADGKPDSAEVIYGACVSRRS